MKLLGLIAFLLLLTTLLSPAGHRARCRSVARVRCAQVLPVRVVRSPWAARAPKTVRRVKKAVQD